MLHDMLYIMLSNMICNVLHNMLRARPGKPTPPLPGPGRPACSARLFTNYLAASLSSSERAMPRFRAGPIGGCVWAVEGAQRRSAGFDSSDGPVVLGLILGVPDKHFSRNVLHRGPCRLRRRLHPASPWRRHPCTRSQAWHLPWVPESP
jgi:hypothetical protein